MNKRFFSKRHPLLIATEIMLAAAAGFSQVSSPSVRPLLQPINIQRPSPTPEIDSPPFVKKTGSVSPAAGFEAPAAAVAKAVKTSIPILAETVIPGDSGVLVESLDGNIIVASGEDQAYNPASNVKIATSYAVLKTFGADYRFPTNFWTDGAFDRSTGTIDGNLYVSGRDPIFRFEHAVAAAAALNRLGVTNITGNVVVTDNFTMNYSSSALRSGLALAASLDASKRSAAANRAWTSYLINSGRLASQPQGIPSVAIGGSVLVEPMPAGARLLFSHESAPMRDIVKTTMCYSNNFLAERLGEMLGGADAVAQFVRLNIGVQPSEFYLQTASGLGINRVTPTAMMKLLRAFRRELARSRMTFADVMPVAGVDKGTLENRFDTDFATGSVVGKTGTLGSTDGGVSALAGEISTRSGTFLFVIFNQRGSVRRFRSFQNNYVSIIQGQFGGPSAIAYTPVSLDARLARSRVAFPSQIASGN